MGVRSAIARLAVRHAHVLVVEAPGGWPIRAAVERAALARGWGLALSPADADVLAVCGTPGTNLDEAIQQVWQQLPGPRVRIDVHGRDEVASRLDEARARLLDTAWHQSDAHDRPAVPESLSDEEGGMDHSDMDHDDMDHSDMDHDDMDHSDMDHSDMDHSDMDHSGMDHSGMDHSGMDHSGMDHSGMDHSGMDMDMSPSGIALAEGADDRDGLEMDVLHVPLGPVLAHWPAGLVVRCALHGDVVAEASAEVLDGEGRGEDALEDEVAHRVDIIASFLALAGWDDAAAAARSIRDALLEDSHDATTEQRLTRLASRVRRSRLLRWSLRAIRPLDEDDLRRQDLPESWRGDTHERLIRMLADAVAALHGKDATMSPDCSEEQIAQQVVGLDLATARLVVASLDIRTLPSHARATHAR